ncbi:MAG: hypothetical protein EYC67_14395 [Betaproteobacteria bacterium]|nr:MAG: hypothetical protein EYC67_14395 [Betaproteobacteria bacterium]
MIRSRYPAEVGRRTPVIRRKALRFSALRSPLSSMKFEDVKDSFRKSCLRRVSSCAAPTRRRGPSASSRASLEGIRRAAIVVADFTEPRPNAYCGIGLAQGIRKRVVPSAREGTVLPFDLANIPTILWKSQRDLKQKLTHRHLLLRPT